MLRRRLLAAHGAARRVGEEHRVSRALWRLDHREPLTIAPRDRWRDRHATGDGVAKDGQFVARIVLGPKPGAIDPEKPYLVAVLEAIRVVGAAVVQGTRTVHPVRVAHECGDGFRS